MTAEPVTLVFLWHMHQPEYADPLTGEYALPWTRLHAVKDYDEFADVLEEHPAVRSTVNLTPSLGRQIQSLGAGVKDLYARLTEKPAAYLTQGEREFILANFFKANFETLIRPYERYAELLFERGRDDNEAAIRESARRFSAQKIRDLQVWANLAWTGGPGGRLRRDNPVVRELLAKGRDFQEEEKLALMEVHRNVCAGLLDKYRRLQDSGIIEISTTPFYHPILPLLLDMKDAQIAHPGLTLPAQARPLAEDARWHVESGLEWAERTFGSRPWGMWPSEGSLSEKTCELLADCRVEWAATDELNLARSLENSNGKPAPEERDAPARVYRLKTSGRGLHLLFRNHDLSDRIGFSYSKMPVGDAVADFLSRVTGAGQGLARPVVSVMLDGENAWEYFQAGTCRAFLSGLFDAVESAGFSCRTCHETVQMEQDHVQPLSRLAPGSWINGNFNIWVGHPEDNAAWDFLFQTRDAVLRLPAGPIKEKAMGLIRVAEGSDWFWWFGDDHHSMDDPIFDRLFRENLAGVCRLLHQDIPAGLLEPIKRTQPRVILKPPTEPFTPTIDGRIRPFYEWLGAGRADVSFSSGSMRKAEYYLERLYWGQDESTLYFCLEFGDLPEAVEIRMDFRIESREAGVDAAAKPEPESMARLVCRPGEGVATATFDGGSSDLICAYEEVLELAIPFSVLRIQPGRRLAVSVSITSQDMELERWPAGQWLELEMPSAAFFSGQWMV